MKMPGQKLTIFLLGTFIGAVIQIVLVLLNLADIESNPYNAFEIFILLPVLIAIFLAHLITQTLTFLGFESIDLVYPSLFVAFALISCLWGLLALFVKRILESSRSRL
jgi:hypothetical protein